MKDSDMTDQILDDIEFELAQGVLPQNELGESIQAIRQLQNETRYQIFQSTRPVAGSSKFVGRQLRFNDMLLTPLQELATRTQRLQSELYEMRRWLRGAPEGAMPGGDGAESFRWIDAQLDALEREHGRYSLAQVQDTIRPEKLSSEPVISESRLPIIGPLINRVRWALRNVRLFYVQHLVGQQAEANYILGSWILHLNQLQEQQMLLIRLLNRELADLQAQWSQGRNDDAE